jgi:hypothetical protein
MTLCSTRAIGREDNALALELLIESLYTKKFCLQDGCGNYRKARETCLEGHSTKMSEEEVLPPKPFTSQTAVLNLLVSLARPTNPQVKVSTLPLAQYELNRQVARRNVKGDRYKLDSRDLIGRDKVAMAAIYAGDRDGMKISK